MALTGKNRIIATVLVGVAVLWVAHYYTVTRLTKMTLLMMAARSGDASSVERELRAGADPDRVWNEGGFRVHGTSRTDVTSLIFATERSGPGSGSHAPVVKLLLAAGANPCVGTSWGESPLQFAVQGRDVESVRALWEGGAACLKKQSGGAVLSAYDGLAANPEDSDSWALVEYLIAHVAQPGEADHPGALVVSTHPAAKAALERLGALGVKADGTSLMLAAIQGRQDLIPWLVAHGADPNAPFREMWGDEGVLPLVRAAVNPNPAGLRALIDAGADLNAVDSAGRTALSALVCESSCMNRPNPLCESQLESVRMLLERGARRAGTSRSGKDLDSCLADRPADPYRADLAALLAPPAAN